MVKCWSRNYYKMRLNILITGLESLNLEMDNVPIPPENFKFLTKISVNLPKMQTTLNICFGLI